MSRYSESPLVYQSRACSECARSAYGILMRWNTSATLRRPEVRTTNMLQCGHWMSAARLWKPGVLKIGFGKTMGEATANLEAEIAATLIMESTLG